MAYGIDTLYTQEGKKMTVSEIEGGGVKFNIGGKEIVIPNQNELTGRWTNNIAGAPGWYRVAKNINNVTGQSVSCGITISKTFNHTNAETHKVELINAFTSSVFKLIYDKSNAKDIIKVRNVISATKSDYFIDIYYGSSHTNQITVAIDNAVDSRGNHWELVNFEYNPEIQEGESVLAEIELGNNTWLGQPL